MCEKLFFFKDTVIKLLSCVDENSAFFFGGITELHR